MKIATFNINSIKARATDFFNWLRSYNPDIVLLQEIKCETESFLFFECESLGYKVAVLGQKSYNGVAILSKYSFTITAQNIPCFQDEAKRYLEILVNYQKKKFYVASVYAPNGCSINPDTEKEKLKYKLTWFDHLYCHIKEIKQRGLPIIVGGDFNVMLKEIDVFDATRFLNTPLYIKEVRDKLISLEYLGLHDAFRILSPKDEGYTFWDYTANSFVTNSGLRIDYLFVTADFAEHLQLCHPDKHLRMGNKPSDHTPLIAEFEELDV